jgi:hypothetical protein
MSPNNGGHLITKTVTTLQHFTTLHQTTLHHTSPNYTSPNYTSPNYTSPNYTSLHLSIDTSHSLLPSRRAAEHLLSFYILLKYYLSLCHSTACTLFVKGSFNTAKNKHSPQCINPGNYP